jgi:hypothetical protein
LFAAVAVGIAVGTHGSAASVTRMPAWRCPGPGGPPGLQNRCEQRPCSGGFDSRPPPRSGTRTNRGRKKVRLDAPPGLHQDPLDHRIQQRTSHSEAAIGRYLADFRQIAALHARGATVAEIRAVTGRSAALIAEYVGIYERARREFPAAPRPADLLSPGAKKGGHGEGRPPYRLREYRRLRAATWPRCCATSSSTSTATTRARWWSRRSSPTCAGSSVAGCCALVT